MTVLLNQKWQDDRLGADETTRKLAVTKKIWRPKIVSINSENVICDDDDYVFWRGYGEEGNIILSEKLVLPVYCTRSFRNFPFDTQICEVKFGSCEYKIC